MGIKMILVFDTETSNLPQHNLPLDHPAQARIVQFACVMLDREFNERASFCSLIKPDGWQIQPGAQSAHGIRQEECEKYGMPIDVVMDIYAAMCDKCNFFVAHNFKFDNELLSIEEAILADMHNPTASESGSNQFCTMQLMTPVCMLPGRNGSYKWPKLMEAYQHVTGHTFIGAHNALRDCRATTEIFKYLVDNKHVTLV